MKTAMKILHPTDFSDCASQAEAHALRLVRALGGELMLLHVAVETTLYGESIFATGNVQAVYDAQRKWAEETLEARLAAIRDTGIAAHWLIRPGLPFEEIVRTAEAAAADLIVMGTHGRSGLNRLLLGSVADRVVRLAPCPVLTVRAAR
jgi:nucleotide-binding universal stress UspA family protein